MASIADILIAKGNAQAQAASSRGNIYADLIRNLSSLPGQVVQEQRQVQQDQVRQQEQQQRIALAQGQQKLQGQQLAQGERAQQEAATLDQIWSDPSVYKPDGTPNREGIQQRLIESKNGHLLPVIMGDLDRLEESRAASVQRQQAMQEANLELLGNDALRLEAAGNDPGYFHLIVSERAKAGILPTDQANELIKLNEPTQVAEVAKRWKAGTKAGKPNLEKLGPGDVLVDKNNPGAPPVASVPAPMKTREVTTTGVDGKPVTRIVEDKPGAEFPVAPKPVEAPTPGTFGDFLAKFAADKGKSPDKLTAREQLTAKAQFDAAGRAPDKPSDDIVQVMGPNGSPIWVRKTDAIGKPAAQAPRAVTGQERGVLAFYNRAKEAVETITSGGDASLEKKIAKSGLMSQEQLQHAPNFLQTDEQQSYRQAQRAFTEARLRKESGAAIPDSEFKNDAKTYFAQPGDSEKTVEQKRAARQTVLDGLKFSAGKAYDEFYGEPNVSPARGGSGPKKQIRYDANGNQLP